jgi:hypothetical protein
LVVSGLNPSQDKQLAEDIANLKPDAKPLDIVLFANADNAQGFCNANASSLEQLGILSDGKRVRTALLVNPAGRLVRRWENVDSRFAEEAFAWLTDTSLDIGTNVADPRPSLEEAGWLPKSAAAQSQQKGLLVLFLATRGPVDAIYIERIRTAASVAKSANISVLGLFPAYDETQGDIDEFMALNKLDFTCCIDPGSCFADVFRATRTPEAFLINSEGKLFYTGSIDSSSWDKDTNQKYLVDALYAVAAGKEARPSKTMPFGTIIRRSKEDDRRAGGGSGEIPEN